MTDKIWEINATLSRCGCGSRVVMRYDPGCTYVHCIGEAKTMAALPDWQLEELSENWNNQNNKSRYEDTSRPN